MIICEKPTKNGNICVKLSKTKKMSNHAEEHPPSCEQWYNFLVNPPTQSNTMGGGIIARLHCLTKVKLTLTLGA